MTTTWAQRIAQGSGRLRFYLTIQGVPHVFQTSGVDLPSTIESSARPRVQGLSIPRQGGSRLDIDRRRMIGGSLTFDLAEDGDGTLAALFAVRTPRKTWVAADESASDTTISIGANTNLSSTGTGYIGEETITWTGTTATTLTGVTRGVYGSRARTHFGDATDGEGLYTQPPSWRGRRVYLYAYFENADGTTTTDLVERVGTFAIEENPTFQGRGAWRIQCSELTDAIANRSLGRGISMVNLDRHVYLNQDDLPLPAYALRRFVAGSTGAQTYAIIGYNDEPLRPRRFVSVDADSITVEANQAVGEWSVIVNKVMHIAILQDTPGQCLAWAAISRLGDLSNGGFDVYPGKEHLDPGEHEWQFGAGIEASEVDTTSFGVVTDGVRWAYVIADEHPFEQMLSDFTLLTRTFWYTDRDGKLAVKKLDPASASVFSFTDSNIDMRSPPTVELDESGIFPRISFECNYDPLVGKYGVRFEFNDVELMRAYPHIVDTHEIKSRTVWLKNMSDHPLQSVHIPGGGLSGLVGGTDMLGMSMWDYEIQNLIRTQFQYRALGGRSIVTLQSDISALDVELGDIVTVTAAVPDLEGASSISSRRALVIGKEPKWSEGAISWRLQLLPDSTARVAPAAIIQSATGAVLTLRQNSTTYPEASGASPGDMFAVGQSVRLYDVSAATTEERIIDSVTATTITLTSSPSFTVQADVDYVTLGDQNASTVSANDSANGYSEHDFAYLMPDEENADSTYTITRLL